MKKVFFIISFIIFTTTYCYCDIDFRNNGDATIKYQNYEEDSISSETIIKLSLGLYNDIQSKANNCYWNQNFSYYEYNGSRWQYIGRTSQSGYKTVSQNNDKLTYDLAFEYRYYFYKFFAFGGGVNVPLKKIETINTEFYTANPYLSFKLKNFLDNLDTLNGFYILLNLGTIVPLSNNMKGMDNLNLGFDIGMGYEYKDFIFEFTYSKYSVNLSNIYYSKYVYDTIYTDSTHMYNYDYYEYFSNKCIVDMIRFKFSIGYKF